MLLMQLQTLYCEIMICLKIGCVGIFVTRTKSKIMKKMNQVWVKNARSAECGDLRGVRSITRGVEKLLYWVECWARAVEIYAGHTCRARTSTPVRFYVLAGFFLVFDGFFFIFLT